MKNKGAILVGSIIAGLGLFGYALYRYFKVQADLLKNFSYKILDFGIERADFQVVKGQLSVLFKSDADVEVVVKKFIVDFYLNGVRIGYIEDTNEFIVPARSESVIPFQYTLNPQLVFGSAVDIISIALQTNDQIFEVDGYATLKSGIFTVSLPIKYRTTLKEILSS